MTVPAASSPAELSSFGHLTIRHDDRVLRPRPWTADQSRWAAELLRTAPAGPVLELCAGAGQIGLLAIALEPRDLVCVDVDPVAVEHLRHNAEQAGLADLVDPRRARLEDALDDDERFAVVIADPPWVPRADTGRFPEDPLLAIDGGEDGLDVARACLAVASRHLLPGGSVVLQLGTPEQAALLGAETDGLAVVEVRTGERGVLVRLDRTSGA
jgi:release factor glutamine methyltransferase